MGSLTCCSQLRVIWGLTGLEGFHSQVWKLAICHWLSRVLIHKTFHPLGASLNFFTWQHQGPRDRKTLSVPWGLGLELAQHHISHILLAKIRSDSRIKEIDAISWWELLQWHYKITKSGREWGIGTNFVTYSRVTKKSNVFGHLKQHLLYRECFICSNPIVPEVSRLWNWDGRSTHFMGLLWQWHEIGSMPRVMWLLGVEALGLSAVQWLSYSFLSSTWGHAQDLAQSRPF